MAGPIRIAILANGSQARREITQTQGTLGRLSGVASKTAKVGFGALAIGAAAFAKGSVDAERQFSTSMRLIQANTKAPATEMDRLNKLAIKLGQDTQFSANEAADAMLELAKAGLDTKTIMGGGLAGTLTLAAAGGTNLANASTIAANAMKAFGLAGRDMDKIAAALAGGANASTASVESLGQALQQVGPGATNAGLSLNETIAALSAFDSAGIKGSDAGTALKTMLTRLVPSTKAASLEMEHLGLKFTNADGSFVSLDQIANRLQRSMGKLSAEQRTQALNTIFGSDASRAATVLLKEGAGGIRAYIKATKDQNAAQKAAQARMSGTEGAIERFNGAMETAKLRLGQELAPLVVKGADAFGDKLVPALESGIKAGKEIGKALAPATSEIAEALGHLAGEGEGAGKVFDDVFIPALKLASEVVGGVVNLVDELPGPVKEIGVQAGIAALVFPRFAAGVTAATGAISLNIVRLKQLQAEMTYTATRAQLTSTALARFGAAAKGAAGIGGLLLLTKGAQEADGAIGGMELAAGGALAGFAVGGPWGFAIGSIVGGLGGLVKAAKDAGDAATVSSTTWKTYASTLDGVTAATTAATEAMVLQELQSTGVLKSATALGLNQTDLVRGILGEKGARERLAVAIDAEQVSIDKLTKIDISKVSEEKAEALGEEFRSRTKNIEAIKSEIGEVAKSTKEKRNDLLVLAQFPDAVITKIQTPGAVNSKRELANLVATYKLTPKQIQTVIELNNIDASKKEIRSLAAEIVKSGKVKPADAWANFFSTDIGKAKAEANKGQQDINTLLGRVGNEEPKVRHGAFGQGLSGDLSALITLARNGGTGVGNNLGSGMYSGLGLWIDPISARAASMVRGAVSAANAAGAIKSPSRETMYTGEMLGAGLVVGLARSAPRARSAGRALMASVKAGVDDGRDGVDDALAKITAKIRKSITGKNQEKRENALLRRLADEYKVLRRNGNEQDRVARKLENARERLKELTDQYKDYATTIRDSIKMTGNVTQLGRQDDGTVSITNLLNDLRNKVVAAQRFSVLLRDLAGQGLSQTAIQQMLDAGPEAALATAEAISFGGASAIAEINQLQKDLAATGTSLGDDMAERYYGAGVDAAQGIVKGLEAEAEKLDKAAVKLANALVAAVKKALGIKSPSKVFAGIGDNVMRGLTIGLDDTYAKRQGAVVAASLEKGFGTPALTAFTDARAAAVAGGQASTVRVRLTAEQVSQLQRGREIQADLDFARGVGVLGETL